MENAIEFHNVNKKYKDFQIKNLSMNVKKGYVTGFIGANGAGKSTTIKMILNLVKKNSGAISVLGMDSSKDDRKIKEKIGFVFDEGIFYESLTLKELKKIIAPAYKQWDEKIYKHYIDLFELPQNKKIKNYSKGMKMKTSLAFALSHHAELIIMDEPTSGLDPIFRRDILDILYDIMQDEKKTIFFSSHITTDLDRIADYITFLHNGELIFSKEFHSISEEYAIVKGNTNLLDKQTEKEFISIRKTESGFEALTKNISKAKELFGSHVLFEKPSLEDIMYFTKKAGNFHV
ncbi:ABC transporter ATP-binding protein [Cytobacillus massiliigabonensis]|uniref:ABC transporter ATP-binding protein n=1 Tax=Cytobacillus massiliigabonensis TaxID=1871011 RepID=UPI000C850274|nr:ABC transporter ATP-binding protein [Cytobacillus massiliigabonensis]